MADYHVMVVLSEAPGHRLRMGELAGRLVFSPSRLTYQISSMVNARPGPQAALPRRRRGSEAVLTAAGLAALVAAAPPGAVRTVRDELTMPRSPATPGSFAGRSAAGVRQPITKA